MNNKSAAGKKGGLARREALSASQLKAQAQHAAAVRWGKPLKATHQGNFEDEFGINVDCYVLDDASKTAVVSQRGMGAALGMGESSGTRLGSFINSQRMAPFVGRELREKLENPLIFQSPWAGGNSPPPSKGKGYDVTILIDLCKAVIEAETEGMLLERQKHIAKQAHIIVNASAKACIRGLVYALAGYDAARQEVIEAFKHKELDLVEPSQNA